VVTNKTDYINSDLSLFLVLAVSKAITRITDQLQSYYVYATTALEKSGLVLPGIIAVWIGAILLLLGSFVPLVAYISARTADPLQTSSLAVVVK
jgi:hypothetical protein